MKREAEKNESGMKSMMSEGEWHKAVDEHIRERNKKIGEETVPEIGMYPPNVRYTYYFGQQNVLASEDLIRHYADALGDTNPLWRNREYARHTRYRGIIAPPTFEVCIAPTYTFVKPPNLPGWTVLVGGAKREYFKVIHAGDEFKVVDKFLGIKEFPKKGKSYRLFIENTQRSYINQRDEVVAVLEIPIIMPLTPPGKMDDVKTEAYEDPLKGLHKLTKEELDRVHRTYEEEEQHRRGSKTLYWKDVVVGEELSPIVMGPLDSYDTCAFFQAIGYAMAFGIKWAIIKADPTYARIDPETGEYRVTAESHLSKTVAYLNRGAPNAYGFGAQGEAMVAHLISNWMGDDGFLKRFSCQVRRIFIFGQVNYIKGKVVRKYVENDEHLVDLECRSEYLNGVAHVEAKATVRLVG